MTNFEILTLTIGGLTAAVVMLQFRLALKSLKADHERRKKQATIEYIQKIRPIWIEAKHEIEKKWGRDPLNSDALKEIDDDFELLTTVRTLLGQLEHLAVGMNSGVYDKDLLYRMSGGQLISIYHKLRPYIKRAQKAMSSAYIEFEELVKDFENRRRKIPSTKGNIVHS